MGGVGPAPRRVRLGWNGGSAASGSLPCACSPSAFNISRANPASAEVSPKSWRRFSRRMVSGISGQGPHTGYKSYGARHATEYAPWANENIIICPSIESLEGLENVEEIATLAVLVRSSRNSGALNVGGPPQ